MMAGRPALFVDRDGVVIVEKEYLKEVGQILLVPRAAEAIARVNAQGIPVVVITNQSGVARGYFAEEWVARVHKQIDLLLAERGAHIDRYYYCPHHPTEGKGTYRIDCACRKPKPGMLLRAAAELDLDLSRSYVIGDRLSDLEAGERAGCAAILVRTGYGITEQRDAGAGVTVLDDLAQAINYILRETPAA
jgi:D-glycero-D-manno-heptose 1,7-bisphosphate phosphatase